jgi:4-hydroxybenzoate polyprenyltransferase
MSLLSVIKLLRPKHWLKNLLIFFPPFLGGLLSHPMLLRQGLLPFICFCFASSAIYVFNDIQDREKDRHHPVKKNRPLASGKISITTAYFLSLFLLAAAIFLGYSISLNFFLLLLSYIVLFVLYSLKLKEIALVDVFIIATGFILRIYAGGIAFQVWISEWLFLCVFLLAIFLSIGKRYSEKKELAAAHAIKHRQTLLDYPRGFLEGALYMSGSAVLVAYSLYIVGRPNMIFTVPLCWFGIFRYIFRIKEGKSGDPISALLKDRVLLTVSFLWVSVVGWAVYW